jgi:hypothetical protein
MTLPACSEKPGSCIIAGISVSFSRVDELGQFLQKHRMNRALWGFVAVIASHIHLFRFAASPSLSGIKGPCCINILELDAAI